MKAFVTGANGFVGSSLVNRLLAEGCEVGGLVRVTSDLRFLDGTKTALVYGDVGEDGAVETMGHAAQGAEVFFHVAGMVTDWGRRADFERVNVEGTRRALAAARAAGVRRFLLVSSAAVHGFGGFRDRTEDDPTPPSPFDYVQTKLRAEEVARAAAGGGPMELVVVRPGNVFGPRDRLTSVPLLRAIRKGLFGYVSGGRCLTCPTYIENLVDALWLAATTPGAAGRTYLVTDGLDVSWSQFGMALADALEVPYPWWSLPRPVARAVAAFLQGTWQTFGASRPPPVTRYRVENAGNDYHFSIARATEELGFEPKVELPEACRRTVAWFKEAYKR